ncbi:hypothetical protein CRI93_09885 [Longimonas halophila]|uniref:DUF2905 domain-containing protein n=1 Tax=Longimonas halophila TaxID=1469170 RepID=A0A2H3NL57_9BACT|nr:DUF2905 domain-containing protein [Longimonas halophila]PEN06579.1 hypothetical protein CRI93_09885 [Longimonas halophila]
MDIPDLARLLIGSGLLLVAVGGLLWASHTVIDWGHLPGDISFETGSMRVYLPLGTMIVASVILTLLMTLLLRMLR